MSNPKQDRQGVRRAAELEQKYDLALLSSFKGGSQSLDLSNLTQTLSQFIATTNAKIQALEKSVGFPVGSIYTSLVETNPTELFGGEWELIVEGQLLVGLDSENELPELFQANDKCFVWKRIA